VRGTDRRTRSRGGLYWVSVTALGVLGVPVAARAEEPVVDEQLPSFEVHGFASQGWFLTLENDFLARNSTKGSFEYSELGLNVTRRLTDTLQFGAQLIARDLGPTGNLMPRVDWFYVDYRFRDWLGLRFGRLKIPYGLYNEVQDVDVARVPVLLPGSVYPPQGREILFAQTGAELQGFVRSQSLGSLEYRAFLGTTFWDSDLVVPVGTPLELELQVRYMVGGRLLWETPLEGLKLAGSLQALRAEAIAYIAGIDPVTLDNRSYSWVGSAEYAAADVVLTAEYARGVTDQRSDTPEVQPRLELSDERTYFMASYRLAPWLQPGAYYSLLFPDVDDRKGPDQVQHDLALTLRFDINDHWLVKAEGHYMYGTAGLNNPLMVAAVTDAEAHWAAFFLKSTAYF
jgi:hypothetical protein